MLLRHAGVQVRDIKKSRRLFRELMGMTPAWSVDKDWTLLADAGGGLLALIQKGHRKHHPHLGFLVRSKKRVSALYEKIKKLKLKASPPEAHRDGSFGFYFKDYDNNHFEVLYFPKKRGTHR